MVKQRRLGVLAQGPSSSSMLKVQVGNSSIGASNPRHDQEWRVWEDVELLEGKVLIPGGVGHASDLIEHPEPVAERLAKYAGWWAGKT